MEGAEEEEDTEETGMIGITEEEAEADSDLHIDAATADPDHHLGGGTGHAPAHLPADAATRPHAAGPAVPLAGTDTGDKVGVN